MKKILLIFLLFEISLNLQAQSKTDSLRTIIEKYASDSLFDGSIIISQKEKVLYQGSFGYSNIETKDTITELTLFPIGSITKQFTATAIMILQEKGLLSINDKISNYMKVPSCMKEIQIKNFMNHTSGIYDYMENGIESNIDSILNFHYKNDTLFFSPNSKFFYCNSGYIFLGLLIESVSGESYSNFLNENIFEPLGMKNTFVFNGNRKSIASAYDENWNLKEKFISTADGGIISNIHDLLIWDRALSNNEILSDKSKKVMFEQSTLENGEKVNYGLGWHINGENKNILFHAGKIATFGAYNQYDKGNDYYVILLTNRILPNLMKMLGDINKELYN